MFKFLKNKIKEAVSKFSKSATEEEVDEKQLTEEQKEILEDEKTSVDIANEEAGQESDEDLESVPSSPDADVKASELEETVDPESAQEEVIEEPAPEEPDEPAPSPLDADVSEHEPLEDVVEDIEDELSDDPADEPVVDDDKTELLEEATPQETVELEEPSQVADVEIDVVDSEPAPSLPQPVDVPEEVGVESESKEDILDEQKEIEDTPSIPDELEEPTAEEPIEEVKEEKKGFFSKLFGKKKEEPIEPVVDDDNTELLEEATPDETVELDEPALSSLDADFSEPALDTQVDDVADVSSSELLDEDVKDATKKKKGFFTKLREKVVKFKLTEEAFEELFWDFELALMENNVALEVIEKVKKDLHDKLTQENVSRKSVEQIILETLKESLDEVLSIDTFDLIGKIKSKKPYVITIVGVNGSGKTTTIGKLIHLFKQKNLSVVVAASDTFRAAAIQQLEEHTTKLDVKLIKHDYNADPSAVAYDAIAHAKAQDIDVVLIDTAGRLQSNSNLMDELKKLIRVNKPDMNIFIGESITGNDCVEQAVAFNEAVGIDGIILSKADIDEKGGAAVSVSYVTKKPILYLATGQTYEDFKLFDKEEILSNLGL